MHSLLLATILLGATPEVATGSLLVLKNSNKPVAAFTGSDITHVAVVAHHGANPWVYEATPDQVRCVPLASYLAEVAELNRSRQEPIRVLALQPSEPYAAEEATRLKHYLQSQLGRRYSVKGYVRGREGDGLHCAQFAATALTCSQRFAFREAPQGISPGELYDQIKDRHRPLVTLDLPPPPAESWCRRTWKQCLGLANWCQWACYETWTFCR